MQNILETKKNQAIPQMHALAIFCMTFCWLAFVPAAVKAQVISGPVKLNVNVSTFTEEEYLPDIEADSYTWKEESLFIQAQIFLRPRAYVSLGWLESSIEQENDIYGDLDFRLNNQAPIFGFGLPIGSMVNIRGQMAAEKYSNASTTSFYQLEDSETLMTGYFETSVTTGNIWAAISFKRMRDTDPVYNEVIDPVTNEVTYRSPLYIRAQELSGLAMSFRPTRQFELGSSVYYEQYETALADQLNINAEIAYNPAWSKTLSFSLGGGYYTEEKETLVNMSSEYFAMIGALDLSINWQLEFSENEQSLLNQVRAFMKYYAGKNISCYFQGEYGQEIGDDKDTFSTFNAGLELVF